MELTTSRNILILHMLFYLFLKITIDITLVFILSVRDFVGNLIVFKILCYYY